MPQGDFSNKHWRFLAALYRMTNAQTDIVVAAKEVAEEANISDAEEEAVSRHLKHLGLIELHWPLSTNVTITDKGIRIIEEGS